MIAVILNYTAKEAVMNKGRIASFGNILLAERVYGNCSFNFLSGVIKRNGYGDLSQTKGKQGGGKMRKNNNRETIF